MVPGGPESPWTAHSTARKIYGGHFVRDESLIDIKGPMPMMLAFITIYAWDATQNSYTIYSVSNMDELQVATMQWTDENTMVKQSIIDRQGQKHFERWTTKIKGDVVTLEGAAAGATGALWTMVKGTMTRTKGAKPVSLEMVGAMPPMQPSDQIKRLARMAGNYAVVGSWTMTPEEKPTTIVEKERIRTIFGGLVVETSPSGEGYEGYVATVWNARQKRYVRFSINSWGLHSKTTGYWSGASDLVFTFEGKMMGQNLMMTSVTHVNDRGQPTRNSGHTIIGAADPFKSFSATYTAKKAGSK
jgi:hypothetical protein